MVVAQSSPIRSTNSVELRLLPFNHLSLSGHQAVTRHGHIPLPGLSLAPQFPIPVNAHFHAGVSC